MPSLRQKVTTYFRQLSFIAEPRDGTRNSRKHDDDDGNFITKYLEGRMERTFAPGPEIFSGQEPTDLPQLSIGTYLTGPHTISAACTGPDEGLTGIKRSKLHLSASYADIDFIDTAQEENESSYDMRKNNASFRNHNNKFGRGLSARKLSNGAGITTTTTTATTSTSTATNVANVTSSASSSDQNANKVPAASAGMRSRKNSKTSLSNLASASAANKELVPARGSAGNEHHTGKATTIVVSMVSTSRATINSKNSGSSLPANGQKTTTTTTNVAAIADANDQNNKNLLNAKTECKMPADTKVKPTTITATTTTAPTTITKELSGNNANGSKTETDKMLEGTTERLLREAVSNQAALAINGDLVGGSNIGGGGGSGGGALLEAIAGVTDWKLETEFAFGISVSLYENNMLTKEPMGSPIADCYGMVARGDAAVMALADGVNWGDGARLAARSAVHGCLDYLDRAIFGLTQECMATTTTEVFVSLLRSLWEGHGCILEVGGALSTLTVAVVLPLANNDGRYVVCACNVGDSLGYVYSKKHGVREFTQASHDITSMRDMRDALGALGPADGNKPELSNLTLSMTEIERGDIVFLTSDGISDNFDPVVGKFAEAWTPDVKLMASSSSHHGSRPGVLAPKRQNKSASAIYARLHQRHDAQATTHPSSAPVRPPRSKKSNSPPEAGPAAATAAPSRPKYMRSHTVIEPRRLSGAGTAAHTATVSHHHAAPLSPRIQIPKSITGLPLVTGPQRHALTLHRLEDLLSYGINGTFSPCVSSRRLCHLLIDFVRMITSARRKTLEQRELFYKLATGPDGVRREVELNRMQHRAARKRVVDSSAFVALPGKLDHATVLAYTAGGINNTSLAQHTDSSSAGSGGGSGGLHFSPLAPLKTQELYENTF